MTPVHHPLRRRTSACSANLGIARACVAVAPQRLARRASRHHRGSRGPHGGARRRAVTMWAPARTTERRPHDGAEFRVEDRERDGRVASTPARDVGGGLVNVMGQPSTRLEIVRQGKGSPARVGVTIEQLTPAQREEVQAWILRRWKSLRYPAGTRRWTDRVPRSDRSTARCTCRFPIMVTDHTRAVVCQTCRRPLRS